MIEGSVKEVRIVDTKHSMDICFESTITYTVHVLHIACMHIHVRSHLRAFDVMHIHTRTLKYTEEFPAKFRDTIGNESVLCLNV